MNMPPLAAKIFRYVYPVLLAALSGIYCWVATRTTDDARIWTSLTFAFSYLVLMVLAWRGHSRQVWVGVLVCSACSLATGQWPLLAGQLSAGSLVIIAGLTASVLWTRFRPVLG